MAKRARTFLGALLAGALCACASYEAVPLEDVDMTRVSKPLGGETLAEIRREMQRTHGDLVRHLRTLDSMLLRSDRSGLKLFKDFFYGYMDDHVEPLLAKDWTSHHPEIGGLDAGIRFVAIEVLAKLDSPHRAEALIDDVKLRFRGKHDLLVDYPVGRRTKLEKALELVEEQYWRDDDPEERLKVTHSR
ncbi:MAG TPA: hypothetical protein VFT98_12765 [Myxococcota bacterium]|nr:hypothetical protein [Myxococcota bacterium]